MNKEDKVKVVEEINSGLSDANCLVVLHYQGLNVDEITNLRRSSKKLGANLKVTKNSLLKRAVVGTKFEKLSNHFTGPIAVSFSTDPLSAIKAVVEFAKKNEKISILAGMIENDLLDKKGINDLAALPPIEEIRAKLLSLLTVSATSLVRIIATPASQLVRVIDQHANKGQ